MSIAYKSYRFSGATLTFKASNNFAFIIQLKKGKKVCQFATTEKESYRKSIEWLKSIIPKYYRTRLFMSLACFFFIPKIEKHLKNT